MQGWRHLCAATLLHRSGITLFTYDVEARERADASDVMTSGCGGDFRFEESVVEYGRFFHDDAVVVVMRMRAPRFDSLQSVLFVFTVQEVGQHLTFTLNKK